MLIEESQQMDSGIEYRKVVEKYQRYLFERQKKKYQSNSSNDKITSAVKKIYLNPLLPQLHKKQQISSQRLQKRASSMLKDPYLEFQMNSNDQIATNLQNSIVTCTGKQNEEPIQKKSFFIGLYKNQRSDSPLKNVTIKELVSDNRTSRSKKQSQILLLPAIQNEISLSKYFVKNRKSRKAEELSFTNKWEREKGTTFIMLEQITSEQIVEEMMKYIDTQEIFRLFFQDYSNLMLRGRLIELIRGIFFEDPLDFDRIFSYFSGLQMTYLEVFYIKYSLAQSLLTMNQTFQQVEKALNQFEEYRYLLLRPPQFLMKLFDNVFYSQVVKGLVMRLFKSASYTRYLAQSKLEHQQCISAIKNSLFPYLVGEYIALPFHAHQRDIKAEMFRQSQLLPYINSVFIIQLKNLLVEYNLDECYVKDVERRLLFPSKEVIPQMGFDEFGLYYVNSWVSNKTTNIPCADIKAMLRVICLQSSDDVTKSQFDENYEYLSQYDHLRNALTIFL